MLKLGSKANAIGTAVPCPACRYPNLGIDIWCARCGMPLEWNGQKPTAAAPPALAPGPPSPAPASVPPAFSLPRLTMPAIAWPRLRMPTVSVPRLRLRVPRIAWVVAAVLAILLIAPLASTLRPSGRQAAARPSAPRTLPSTNANAAGETPPGAAIPGVEAKTGLRFSTGPCPTKTACLMLASQTVGQDAAAVVFSTAGSDGRQCAGYVYRAGGQWHFLDAVCGLPGQVSPLVGHDATVRVPGNCANVRNGTSLKAGVVACLKDGTTVRIDGGPAYADGRLWWHEKRGWMAHDFLMTG